MSSSLYPVSFDCQIVRETVVRVLVQTWDQDEALISRLERLDELDLSLPSTPAHSKALAILLVFRTYPSEQEFSIEGGLPEYLGNVAHQTTEQDLVTIDALEGRGSLTKRFRSPKLIKVEAMAQILRHRNCVP